MCIDRYGNDRLDVRMVCDYADLCLCVHTSQVHGGRYHCDGGCDVRGVLRGRLHRPSTGSWFHGALRPQLSQWVSLPVRAHVCPTLCHSACRLYHTEGVSRHQGHPPKQSVLHDKEVRPTDGAIDQRKTQLVSAACPALVWKACETFGAWTSNLPRRSMGNMH